jgi:hypothetical protein
LRHRLAARAILAAAAASANWGLQLVFGPNIPGEKRDKLDSLTWAGFATGGPVMISSTLVVAIGLALAVLILGAALVWAFLEARQNGAHPKKHRLPHHAKSSKRPLKAPDR